LSFDPLPTIAALAPWDVIYPFDDRINPTKHKMWVCVSKTDFWFLRINSRTYDGCCIPLAQANNSFLAYDSYLRCGGDLITVAEAELERLLRLQRDRAKQGIVGAIHASERATACAAIRASRMLTPSQVRTIARELGCP
jgi:hypothetical protein